MKSIVICGSKRFKPEIRKLTRELEKLGITVYYPYLHEGREEWDLLSEDYKKYVALGLTHDHFYKIRIADVVYIFNKDGYAGVSTTMEIAYAVALGKPVYCLSDDDPELSRKVLFRGKLKNAKEIASVLK